ncbi:MAG: hypothetical protein LBC61_04350 [Candidatus Peribacteria bacterium]|nr:hypothetical protein [Candidatus Peribacteria bacterium]
MSPAQKYCATNILQAIENPLPREIIKNIIFHHKVSAANESSLGNLPTQKLSINWYQTCNKFVRIIGIARNNKAFQIGIFVKSCICLFSFSFISYSFFLIKNFIKNKN